MHCIVMTADVENQKQKKPLIRGQKKREVQEDDLLEVMENDNTGLLEKLMEKEGRQAVLRPIPTQNNRCNIALHLAVEKNAEECLKLLLNPRPHVNILDAPNHDGWTPLVQAVRQVKPEMVRLLKEAGANVNTRDDNGFTPLHSLVHLLSARTKPDDVKNLLVVADHLLAKVSIDLEPHADLTPLATAVYKLTDEDDGTCNKGLITYCKKLIQKGASLQENTGQGSVNEVLQKNPTLRSELQLERPLPPPQRPASSCFLDLIYDDTSSELVLKKFLKGITSDEAVASSNSLYGKHSVLYMAVDACNELRVQTLLSYKASPWRKEPTGELPLHRAAERGDKNIFDGLLRAMKGEASKVDLQNYTMSLMERLMENWKRNTGHADCFKRLFEADIELNLNEEHVGRTPVHVAASFNKQEAVSNLLQHGAFLGARPWITKDTQCSNVLPSLKASTLEKAMDGCIKHLPHSNTQQESEDLNNDNHTLLLDYRFLLPPDAAKKDVNEVATLMDISRSKHHRRVIKHPLVQTLLYAKWRKALPFYLLNLFFYALFVTLLTVFVYSLRDLRLLETDTQKTDQSEEINNLYNRVVVIKIFLLALTLYMLGREILQIVFSGIQYLKNIENFLEILLILFVFILCIPNLNIDFIRHLAAWAMVAAWYEFVLILGRAPPLALYITMLRHVSWNFVKFILLFGALIVAFTISFNMLLQQPQSSEGNDKEFQDFGSTLPKAIVMSTGEFDYSSLKDHFSNNTIAMASTVLMFLIFLFLIFLVLMNVMNALAITDIQEVVDDAELYSLMSRLELVYLIEAVLLWCLSKCDTSVLKSPLGSLQLLSGDRYSCRLLAKINRTEKKQRLLVGKIIEDRSKLKEENLSPSKLDDTTAQCLRNHRMVYQEALEAEEREDQMNAMLRVENLLRSVVKENPEDIKRILASVKSGQ
ncbi:hypothetical protein Pmani_032534 [Petrolisthes manimaculis]|uniref:Ion transport domain-containing protein n=1 Tax=Petrolisthes manimaculis TaxID=1843537 RepID=A0AAE1NT57_9EUCA|nr:hypothetical protein Pmani_032534 [Petrolisthes manimaculis]